jgi:hypothetical protein
VVKRTAMGKRLRFFFTMKKRATELDFTDKTSESISSAACLLCGLLKAKERALAILGLMNGALWQVISASDTDRIYKHLAGT